MPIKLHNKDYYTVAERLAVAHADNVPKGIKSISSTFLVIGGNALCQATVTFEDGRSFQGTAEVPLNSQSPAERDAPHECAETSAWGRALAAAGYPGSESGLAGAEEVQRPPRQNAPRQQAPTQGSWPQRPAPPAQDVNTVPAGIVADTERMRGSSTEAPNLYAEEERRQVTDDSVTEPQLRLLGALAQRLQRDVPQGLTRQTASTLIGEWQAAVKGAA